MRTWMVFDARFRLWGFEYASSSKMGETERGF